MISYQIAKLLEPFAKLANPSALSDNYKCLEIQKGLIRGCSAFGILEATAHIGIDAQVFLNTTVFANVMKSLPADEEVSFKLEGGALRWECGMAEGKLAVMPALDMPAIEWRELVAGTAWEPSKDFASALELGAISCTSRAMTSAGIFGVMLDNRNDLRIMSSDNVTLAVSFVGDSVAAFEDQFVISPDAAALLAMLLKRVNEPLLEMDKDSINLQSKIYRLMLRRIPPMKHDLRELSDAYSAADAVVKLAQDRIQAFIRRVAAMTESKDRAYVTLAAAEGALALSFLEGNATTDEYYLVDGLEIPSLPEIKLDAMRMARVLSHVNELVLDHIERGVVLLRGAQFTYLISGRK